MALADASPIQHALNRPLSLAATSTEARFIANAQATCDTTVDDDCDDDGLTNEVELYELGTNYLLIDTDGDLISDKTEVEGFNNGQPWYLDPLNPDSNGDGILGGLECAELVDILDDGTLDPSFTPAACLNSD